MKQILVFCIASMAIYTNALPLDKSMSCSIGGDNACQLACRMSGYVTGKCDENNDCHCEEDRANTEIENFVNALKQERSLSCSTGGDNACQLACRISGYVTGKCDENNDCRCEDKANTQIENFANALKQERSLTCKVGGDKACNLYCRMKGYSKGSCDDKNDCNCIDNEPQTEEPVTEDSLEITAEKIPFIQEFIRQRTSISCTIGGDVACNIACKYSGKHRGHCDETQTCICYDD